MVSGKVKYNQQRNRTRIRFSSDGDPEVTYGCKLDDGKFDDCEFIIYYCCVARIALYTLAKAIATLTP